jgi:hypothetical protein
MALLCNRRVLTFQHPSAPFPDEDGVLTRSTIVAIKRDDNAVFGYGRCCLDELLARG